MTTRTTYFGGTDFSDVEVLYAADLNDTFLRAIPTKNIKNLTASARTIAASYTTVYTLDFTSGGEDLKVYSGILYATFSIGNTNPGSTAYLRLKITDEDDTVTYSDVLTNTNGGSDVFHIAKLGFNGASGKKLKQVEIQTYCSTNQNNNGVYSYANTTNDQDATLPRTSFEYDSYGTY